MKAFWCALCFTKKFVFLKWLFQQTKNTFFDPQYKLNEFHCGKFNYFHLHTEYESSLLCTLASERCLKSIEKHYYGSQVPRIAARPIKQIHVFTHAHIWPEKFILIQFKCISDCFVGWGFKLFFLDFSSKHWRYYYRKSINALTFLSPAYSAFLPFPRIAKISHIFWLLPLLSTNSEMHQYFFPLEFMIWTFWSH